MIKYTCAKSGDYVVKYPLFIQYIIEIIGKKWSIHILADIHKNKVMKFSDVYSSLNPITSKVLTKRLKDFENDALFEKQRNHNKRRINVEYSFTKSCISALCNFTIKWNNTQNITHNI